VKKLNVLQQASERKKVWAVGVVAVLIMLANVVPLHHSSQHDCPGGGSYKTQGTTFGLPIAYFETWKDGLNSCPGFYGTEPSSGFSAQAFLTDALVFGVIMVGLNALVDRRTKA
jgi:hypothetical protein